MEAVHRYGDNQTANASSTFTVKVKTPTEGVPWTIIILIIIVIITLIIGYLHIDKKRRKK